MKLRYDLTTQDFRGVQTLNSQYNCDPKFGAEATNIEFQGTNVQIPRFGFGPINGLTASVSCRASIKWQSDYGQVVVYYGVASSGGAPGALYALTGINTTNPSLQLIANGLIGDLALFAVFGNQLFVAFVDTNQQASDETRVITHLAGNTFLCNKILAPPLTVAPTITTSSIGFTTVGTHRIGYIPEYTDNHLGRPCPDTTLAGSFPDVTTFSPVEGVIASAGVNGGGTLTVNFTSVSWPTNLRAIHLIMTPVTNENDFYFVPGGRYTVPSGTTSSLALNISLSDSELLANAESANDYLKIISSAPDVLSTPVVRAKNVFTSGRRLCLITDIPTVTNTVSAIYVSELDEPQRFRADISLVKLTDGGDIKSGVAMDNGFILAGNNSIAMVTDTSGEPAQWPVRFIDSSRGVRSMNSLFADKSSPSTERADTYTRCWLISKEGIIHTSGGSINQRSVTEQWKVGWWDRINWNASNRIQFVDIPEKFMLVLGVPLDNANYITHLFTVHYFLGKAENQVNFSVTQVTNYQIGSMCLFYNNNPRLHALRQNFKDELMILPFVAGNLIGRMKGKYETQFDGTTPANPYTDEMTGTPLKIPAIYKTSIRPKLPGSLNFVGNALVGMSGRGTPVISISGLPRVPRTKIRELTLVDETRQYIEAVSFLRRCIGVHVEFEVRDSGDYMILSMLRTEHQPIHPVPPNYAG